MSNKPLKAGPELDAAVARALGWDFTITADGDVKLTGAQSRDLATCLDLFRISNDLETAFEVAGECGLFTYGRSLWYTPCSGWHQNDIPNDGEHNRGSRGALTPEVAIAWAIIDLKTCK